MFKMNVVVPCEQVKQYCLTHKLFNLYYITCDMESFDEFKNLIVENGEQYITEKWAVSYLISKDIELFTSTEEIKLLEERCKGFDKADFITAFKTKELTAIEVVLAQPELYTEFISYVKKWGLSDINNDTALLFFEEVRHALLDRVCLMAKPSEDEREN